MLLSLGTAALVLTAVGCSKSTQEKATDKISSAYETSVAAVSDTWGDVKDYTLEKSHDFKLRAEAISSSLDAKVAKLKADYAEAKASDSRKAAMQRITDAQATLSEKIAALGNATAATWDSAKADVIAATKKLEAAYDDYTADAAAKN